MGVARHIFAALCLLLGALFAYRPVLDGGFVWDDLFLVGLNPFIRSPLLAGEVVQRWLFEDGASPYYRPIQSLSYLPDYWLWHYNPFGYHLTNVLIHAAAGWLLFLVLHRILPAVMPGVPVAEEGAAGDSVGERQGTGSADAATARGDRCCGRRVFTGALAFVVAFLWVIHPVHNAAVAYISGRADPLAAGFALLGWIVLRSGMERRPGVRRILLLLAASGCALAALGSKEIALVWLLWATGWELWFSREIRLRGRIGLVLGLAAVVAVYLAMRSLPPPARAVASGAEWTPAERVVLVARTFGDYCTTFVAPFHLRMDRVVYFRDPGPGVSQWSRFPELEVLTWAGLLCLPVFVLGWLRRGEWWRMRRAGILWFLFGYLPFSHLLPIGNAQAAEHWIYMPSIGLVLFASAAALELGRVRPRLAATLVCVFAAFWGVRTFLRAADWRSPISFYESSIRDGATSARIWMNYAGACADAGQPARALAILRWLGRMDPQYTAAKALEGRVLAEEVGATEAAATTREGAEAAIGGRSSDPRAWRSSLVHARALAIGGQVNRALEVLQHTRRQYGDQWQLAELESGLRARTGDLPGAERVLEVHLSRAPWDARALRELALLQGARGDRAGAEALYRQAIPLDVRDGDSLVRLSALRREGGASGEELSNLLSRAVRRQPDSPHIRIEFANVLRSVGRSEEADQQEHLAIQLIGSQEKPLE